MQARIRELPAVPGKDNESEPSVEESMAIPNSSAVEPHPPAPLASAPLPSTLAAPPRVNPVTSAPSEIGSNETETSLNQLTGE
jgi:hypothetical protein